MRATTLATYWRRPSRPRCFGLVCLLCCCFFFLFNLCSFRFNFSVQPTFVRCFMGQVCLWVHMYIYMCVCVCVSFILKWSTLTRFRYFFWGLGFLPAISAYWCLRVLLYCCIFCNSVVCFYVGVYRAPSSSPYKCRLARHIMGHSAIQSHFCSFYVCLSVSRVSLSLSRFVCLLLGMFWFFYLKTKLIFCWVQMIYCWMLFWIALRFDVNRFENIPVFLSFVLAERRPSHIHFPRSK